jgi:hypothetical protein
MGRDAGGNKPASSKRRSKTGSRDRNLDEGLDGDPEEVLDENPDGG